MQTFTENSEAYQALLQSEHWQKRRKQILERDNYNCVRCGSTHNLNVHHRQYHKKTESFINPWAYKSNNLVTLCRPCHQLGHKLFKIPVFNV
jgi:5-methylcytosine-specific restriction endonuclease McrA